MYYFRIEKLRHSSRAAEVYFATFVLKSFELGLRKCTWCIIFVMNVLKTVPRKFRDGVRESYFFSREDGGFRNKEFQFVFLATLPVRASVHAYSLDARSTWKADVIKYTR